MEGQYQEQKVLSFIQRIENLTDQEKITAYDSIEKFEEVKRLAFSTIERVKNIFFERKVKDLQTVHLQSDGWCHSFVLGNDNEYIVVELTESEFKLVSSLGMIPTDIGARCLMKSSDFNATFLPFL